MGLVLSPQRLAKPRAECPHRVLVGVTRNVV